MIVRLQYYLYGIAVFLCLYKNFYDISQEYESNTAIYKTKVKSYKIQKKGGITYEKQT